LAVLLLAFSALVLAIEIADERQRYCHLETGKVLEGNYPENGGNAKLSGRRVYLAFGADGRSATETSRSETVFVEWEIDDDESLAVRDFGSNPNNNNCPVDVVGSYETTWTQNCFQLDLNLIEDSCVERSVLYDGLTVYNVRKKNTDECGFFAEQVWTGFYPTKTSNNLNNDYAGRPVTVVIGSDGESIIEHSDFGTFFGTWDSHELDALFTRDWAANPIDLQICPTSVESQYTLSWSKDCSSVKLTLVADACQPRGEQYDGLILTRVEDFEVIDNAAGALTATWFTLFLSLVVLAFF